MAVLVLLIVLGYCFYVLCTVGARRVKVTRLETVPGTCVECSYSLDGLGERPRCPECGRERADEKPVETVEFVSESPRVAWFLLCVLCIAVLGYLGPHLHEWIVTRRQQWPLCLDRASERAVMICLGVLELLVFWHLGVVRQAADQVGPAARAFMLATTAGWACGLALGVLTADRHDGACAKMLVGMVFAGCIALGYVAAANAKPQAATGNEAPSLGTATTRGTSGTDSTASTSEGG